MSDRARAISMKDSICLACEIAFTQHKRGEISREQLIEILQLAINATAEGKGYTESHGKPFPKVVLPKLPEDLA